LRGPRLVPRPVIAPRMREDESVGSAAPTDQGGEAGVQGQKPVAVELAVADLPVDPRTTADPLQLAAQVERSRAPVDPLEVKAENLVSAEAVRHGGQGHRHVLVRDDRQQRERLVELEVLGPRASDAEVDTDTAAAVTT